MAARSEEKRNLDLRIAETEADLSEETVLREDADIRVSILIFLETFTINNDGWYPWCSNQNIFKQAYSAIFELSRY